MNILGIETSCDETAVAIIEAKGDKKSPDFTVRSHALYSQADKHAEYGGVYPSLAKREHAQNLTPLFEQALKEAELFTPEKTSVPRGKIEELLEREPELAKALIPLLEKTARPDIDLISVTSGPGLEPALWVGINFARVLSLVWDIPILGANHMEGHIASVLFAQKKAQFPALALLVSGGHTELILIKQWGSYEKIGSTLDDAAGEAFDKVARLLNLPYPGGPHISRLAAEDRLLRTPAQATRFALPRPMLQSDSYDFSYSGLKTAVLYKVRDMGELSATDKREIAREFEDAVTETLLGKTKRAVDEYGAQSLILAGGVIANTHIRDTFEHTFDIPVLMPDKALATDNAVMIALAGFLEHEHALPPGSNLRADGNLSL